MNNKYPQKVYYNEEDGYHHIELVTIPLNWKQKLFNYLADGKVVLVPSEIKQKHIFHRKVDQMFLKDIYESQKVDLQ